MSENSNSDYTDLVDRIEHIICEMPPDEIKQKYTEWAEKYEKELQKTGYEAHLRMTEAFLDLKVPTSKHILEIGAGTGLVGNLLKRHGYHNVDALDGCIAMLEKAKEKKAYANYIEAFLSVDEPFPFPDDCYDVLLSCGVFAPGHLTSDYFPELIRITKPGGLICWMMRKPSEYVSQSVEFNGGRFEQNVELLCKEGKWKKVHEPRILGKFFNNYPGVFYAMRVCS